MSKKTKTREGMGGERRGKEGKRERGEGRGRGKERRKEGGKDLKDRSEGYYLKICQKRRVYWAL